MPDNMYLRAFESLLHELMKLLSFDIDEHKCDNWFPICYKCSGKLNLIVSELPESWL
jgi:hypothetical protein